MNLFVKIFSLAPNPAKLFMERPGILLERMLNERKEETTDPI
jgi:hypothetical protein